MPKGSIDAKSIKLDGTKTREDGSIEKSDFFNFLDLPDGDYSDITLSPEQAIAIRNFAIKMKFGTSAMMPLRCLGGSKCPIKSCPFTIGNNWPIGRSCPLEIQFIQTRTKSYIEDLDIKPDSATEMSLVNRLVELDLMDFRANAGIAANEDAQTLLQKVVLLGEKFSRETLEVHPLVEIKDKHHKQRMQILEALVATRREKYKKAGVLRKKDTEDTAHHLSKLRKVYQQLTKDGLVAIEQIKQEADEIDESQEADWVEEGDSD